MTVVARYESEKGEPLEVLPDLGWCLNVAISLALKRPGCFLKSIDPYGDTSFNYLQRPLLLNELEEMKNTIEQGNHPQVIEAKRTEVARYLASLIQFVRTRLEERSVHLRFIGD